MSPAAPPPAARRLLTAVSAAPGWDDLPRLAYADWLEGRGDRQRAAFVRGQAALYAAGDPHGAGHPRERAAVEQFLAAPDGAAGWVAAAGLAGPDPDDWQVVGPPGGLVTLRYFGDQSHSDRADPERWFGFRGGMLTETWLPLKTMLGGGGRRAGLRRRLLPHAVVRVELGDLVGGERLVGDEQHLVADVLDHPAAAGGDHVGGQALEPLHQGAEPAGLQPLREPGVGDQVGESDGERLPAR